MGKVSSWVVLALLVWVSTREHLTLVRLLVLKFEVLIQVAPAFYLGLNVPAVRTAPILAGVIAGLLTSLLLWSKGVQLGGLRREETLGLLHPLDAAKRQQAGQ